MKVKAKDIHGAESDWSDNLLVKISKSYSRSRVGFISLSEMLLNRIFKRNNYTRRFLLLVL